MLKGSNTLVNARFAFVFFNKFTIESIFVCLWV